MKLKLNLEKKIQKSTLKGYGLLPIADVGLEQFIGKKCLITGEIEITEIKEKKEV